MPESEKRGHRNRSISRAISTSLVSKVSSAALQFLSLPLAARVLGREEFGIYAAISLTVFAVAMLQLGVGPALGRKLSEASARSDRDEESRVYLSGAILVLSFAALGFLIVAILIANVPIPTLFGSRFAPFEEVMRPALWIGALLMTGQVIVAMTDRVREGYMEAAVVNCWSAAGNLAGAVVVFVGIRYQPSVSFLLIAVFGPNILARLISTALLLRQRPWLISKKSRPSLAAMKELIRDGVSFSATSFVVYTVEFSVCALLVGRFRGPGDVAVFLILMAITNAFDGFLRMVGTPLWAAIIDAKSKGDVAWMLSARRRYYQYLATLTALASVALIGLGPWLIPKLYGAEFAVDRVLLCSHAAFLFALGWRQANRYLVIGLGLLSKTVMPILVGLFGGLLLGTAGLQLYGMWALFAGLAIGTLGVAGVLLPRLVRREIHAASAAVPEVSCDDDQRVQVHGVTMANR